ncbi:MAG: hypothetical protein ACXV5Q_07410 [Frankiaceae bacterium]
MALHPANHYVISGKGIDAVIDTAGISGVPVVSLTVAGRSVTDPTVTTTSQGLVVEAVVDEVPDSHSILIRLTVPEVNVADEPVTFAGFAVLTRALTSFGGPRLVTGVAHLYEIRPVAGTASAVVS